jgi:uncharacterized protein YjbJ (UPF0337 family)
MNTHVAKDDFTLLRGKIKARWRALPDEEIDELEGHVETTLARKLQEHYGWERAEAELQVREFRRLHHCC